MEIHSRLKLNNFRGKAPYGSFQNFMEQIEGKQSDLNI